MKDKYSDYGIQHECENFPKHRAIGPTLEVAKVKKSWFMNVLTGIGADKVYTAQRVQTQIKYCPFCGEELL